MNPREKHSVALDALLAKLRQKPMTARQISEIFGISRPGAYKRIQALIRRGNVVSAREVRHGITGPSALAFYVLSR